MRNVHELIQKLNAEQIKPVLDTEGAVLVIAGAGSGKTRVLTTRIAYLVANLGVLPEEILAITFTNKAASEMKERLVKILDDIGGMWVSTIHSMCVKILRQNADKLGYDKFFTIYDETDKEKVLKRIFTSLNYEQDKFLKSFKNLISSAKNDCLSPEGFASQNRHMRFIDEFTAVYKEYESELQRSNSMDFDDLLCKTYNLFLRFPEVCEYYAKQFKYVHIDEFQDTNTVQFNLAKMLASCHKNLFVVGDDDQSIYSWRGAKIENILNFDKTFQNAKVYKLERNYRSTKKILDLANCIILNNTGRRGKELWTDKTSGTGIETFVGQDENAEASYVAIQIKNLVQRGYSYSDFAVFMRLNAISRAFEQEFLKYGIPYKIYGGFRFFERKEIKDVLSYLKIINNFKDDEAFMRAVISPKRGIGDKTLISLKEFAVSKNCSIFEAIDYGISTGLSASALSKLVNFKNMILNFKEYEKENGLLKVINYILETTGYLIQYEDKTEENLSKIYNVNELKNTAELFEAENGKNAGLSEFLNSVTLSSDTDDILGEDAVTVATIHSAKGLEFRCVFVAGLDEDILPINRTDLTSDDLEEERRLMYVAVTRAKERLYLTRAFTRYLYGSRRNMTASRFLKEGNPVLSPSIVTSKKEEGEHNFGRELYSFKDEDSLTGSAYSSSYAKKVLTKKLTAQDKDFALFKTGTKVMHPKFGEGMIISEKGEGGRKTVDVAFKGLGIKSLSVKYAPMEIIK